MDTIVPDPGKSGSSGLTECFIPGAHGTDASTSLSSRRIPTGASSLRKESIENSNRFEIAAGEAGTGFVHEDESTDRVSASIGPRVRLAVAARRVTATAVPAGMTIIRLPRRGFMATAWISSKKSRIEWKRHYGPAGGPFVGETSSQPSSCKASQAHFMSISLWRMNPFGRSFSNDSGVSRKRTTNIPETFQAIRG